ncbi:MAG: M48 family metallopeptidase [Planctomycetes bacterium]|nr:M48 family metallopeptidase [Planctomycetota bacterium]
MDFFEAQDRARRNTFWLVVLFLTAVALIIAGVYLLIAGVWMMASQPSEPGQPVVQPSLWDPEMFALVAGATLLIVFAGSLYKTMVLSAGGEAVASLVGARPINPETRDFYERRLLNVVEEMAIASGIAVPTVYVLDGEESINAFAAGLGREDAIVAVTEGTLRLLKRDELQGVVAHEFSHILNGDMRMNVRLIGILHGIFLISMIGYLLFRSVAHGARVRRRSRNGGGGELALILIGLGLMALGWIGVFFGRLIKAAVSRQREFLADAAAVQFTRNPDGIAGALKKIGGLVYGSRVDNPHAEEISHLFFGDAFRRRTRLFATHPPLEERVRRIDPSFDGRFPKVSPEPLAAEEEEGPSWDVSSQRTAIRNRAARPTREVARQQLPFDPMVALATVGTMAMDHLAYATALRQELPKPLAEEARNPFGARAVVYGLLLDEDTDVRQRQMQELQQRADPQVMELLKKKLLPHLNRVSAEMRLPLASMCLPALRQLSPSQYQTFHECVTRLAKADQRISVFEYALHRLLLTHLTPQYRPQKRRGVQYYSMKGVGRSCQVLLSALAHFGHDDPAEGQRAYETAVSLLRLKAPPPLLARSECGIAEIDQSLRTLREASPAVKKRVLEACMACVGADQKITVAEAELIRTIADTLDCPMPPLLAGSLSAPAAS